MTKEKLAGDKYYSVYLVDGCRLVVRHCLGREVRRSRDAEEKILRECAGEFLDRSVKELQSDFEGLLSKIGKMIDDDPPAIEAV